MGLGIGLTAIDDVLHGSYTATMRNPDIERPHKLTVMLSEAEMAALKARARDAGVDVSTHVRLWIRRRPYETQATDEVRNG